MDDHQCTEAYNALSVILRNSGLAWLVDEVETDIQQGKLVEVRAPILGDRRLRDPQMDGQSSRSQSRISARAKLLQSVPFSGIEKLRLLIDAMDAFIVSTQFMESAIVRSLREGHGELREVKFHSDAGDREVSIEMDSLLRESPHPVHRLLGELRGLIDGR